MSAPPPLGVYIHWPYCARICPYCDFNVYRDRGRDAEKRALAEAIAVDLEAQSRMTGPRRLASIFFGGGTPSLMTPDQVAQIIDLCRRLWPQGDALEISLEANPTDAEADRFAALSQAGVNRLSLGVQSLDDAQLAFLGRNHSATEAHRAAILARRLFARLSIDLIYALPGQTEAGWRSALNHAVDLGAEHISPYQLTIEQGTAFDRAVRRGRQAPVESELAARLYDATQEVLSLRGYSAYEVSNHALGEAARSRHNLVYWRGEDYIGVGPGAHGRLTTPEGRLATEAVPAVGAYIDQVLNTGLGFKNPERLDGLEQAQERLLMGLRLLEGVRWTELAPLGLHPADPRVRDLESYGLVVWDGLRLRATSDGRRILDSVTRALAA